MMGDTPFSYLTVTGNPLLQRTSLVLEEKVLLAKVPYRLDELNLTTTTEVSSGSPRRICGQDNYISING